MVRWLGMVLALGLVPTAAQAIEPHQGPTAASPPASSGQRLNFRLVQDNLYDSRPITVRSGMIASAEVAPRTTIGVGIIKAPSRRTNVTDPRIDSRGTASRRAAVTFQFRF